MKKRKQTIKETIKKRNELREGIRYLKTSKGTHNTKNMGSAEERRKLRTVPGYKKPILNKKNLGIPVDLRHGKNVKLPYKPYQIKDYGVYVKKENVDYDVVIYISSYNRYNKLERILNHLFTEETKYSFKIIVMNDGSTQYRYNKITKKFPEIIYLKNKKNNGKLLYWKTLNNIFNNIKEINTHAVIQIDDDFILCKNFLNKIVDLFFEIKEENNSFMLIKYHLGALDSPNIDENTHFNSDLKFQGVDGGTMFDINFLDLINFKLNDTEKWMKYGGSGVWNYLNDKIIEHGVCVYTTRKSLVYHDGNEDSKMHPDIRKIRKYYTINFINEK